MLNKFWTWYERHYRLNLAFTTVLFLWQLVHLYWLTTNVVAQRLLGHSLFDPSNFWNILLVLVDYTEIPALITTSILYLHEMKRSSSWKPVIFLVLLNSQWLHLFWITDEYVVEILTDASIVSFPVWLAWLAIGIDYLELPVMFDTTKKFIKSLARA